MLQQGVRRYYLVNTSKNGKTARPALLFDYLLKKPCETFSEICGNVIPGRWHKETEEIMPEHSGCSERKDVFTAPFSKSSFNAYYSCPRQYLFSKMLTTPEEKNTLFGTLIHEFAEFYACYPQDVKELGVDHFVEMVADRYSGLSSPMLEQLDKDKIRKAMNSIIAYIDHIGVKDLPLDVPLASKSEPNGFMTALGKEYTSSRCEMDIPSDDLPIHGKFDMTWNGVITDYKTGKSHTPKDIYDSMTFGSGSEYPEFQPVLYLSLIRGRTDYRGTFNLFYAMDDDTSPDDSDIMRKARTVVSSEKSLFDIAANSGDLMTDLESELSKDLKGHAKEIVDFLIKNGSSDPDEWSSDEALVGCLSELVLGKRTETSLKTMRAGINKVVKHFVAGSLVTSDKIELSADTLNEFAVKVKEYHQMMVEQSRVDYPAIPKIDCAKCRYRSVCTEDIVSEGGDDDAE